MTGEIDSFSISDLFWIQYKNTRISFRIKGLPEDIHFTISWHKNSTKVNFHITKNVGDGTNKPQIVIAEFDKQIIDELISFVPACIINHLYRPISFKRYSRESRKNIRLCHLDDLDRHKNHKPIEEKITKIFKDAATVKKQRLKVNPDLESDFIPLLRSTEIKSLLLSNLKCLTRQSFQSKVFRAGILFMGNRTVQFISSNDKCYILREKMTMYDLLTSFMKPELAKSLFDLTVEALDRIKDAQTYSDTEPYNRPYHLFIESVAS